jgi:hypothetical protein
MLVISIAPTDMAIATLLGASSCFIYFFAGAAVPAAGKRPCAFKIMSRVSGGRALISSSDNGRRNRSGIALSEFGIAFAAPEGSGIGLDGSTGEASTTGELAAIGAFVALVPAAGLAAVVGVELAGAASRQALTHKAAPAKLSVKMVWRKRIMGL